MNRRELLTLNPPVERKKQDFSYTQRTLSGLTPYTGAWTLAEVKHLLRRAMFGSPKADAEYFVGTGMANAITELLTPSAAPIPPLYTYTTTYNDPNVPFGSTWVNAPYDVLANGKRTKSF